MTDAISLCKDICCQLENQGAKAISADQSDFFKPATHAVYEWHSYRLNLPEEIDLWVGGRKLTRNYGNTFLLEFKNQIGITRITVKSPEWDKTHSVCLEVLSQKFDTLEKHRSFYAAVLSDLFYQISTLPFTFQADTGRAALETIRPPTPLFTFHFIKNHSAEISSSIETVLASPHRLLVDEELVLPISTASSVDADAVINMFRQSSSWVKREGHPLAVWLRGYVPTQIEQRLSQETFDSPENRFIKHFLSSLLQAVENLYSQPWWVNVSAFTRDIILETHSMLQQTCLHPMFDEVGDQHVLPSNSQVLLRKEGYRQLLGLWQIYQQARRPLFEPLFQAIDTRDIATLYEFWIFFQLVEIIGEALAVKPILELRSSEAKGLEWTSRANFGKDRSLVFNHVFQRQYHKYHSYSTTMRPDYTWELNGYPVAVFDAKFKFISSPWLTGEDEILEEEAHNPTQDDLNKMHTYRDATGVHSAIILYPGDGKVFFATGGQKTNQFELTDILSGKLDGIGAIPLKPSTIS